MERKLVQIRFLLQDLNTKEKQYGAWIVCYNDKVEHLFSEQLKRLPENKYRVLLEMEDYEGGSNVRSI